MRDTLKEIAALHAKNFVHTGKVADCVLQRDTKIVTDIKPDNILVDWKLSHDQEIVVEHVQITDVEDACHLPPGHAISGLQVGNWMWRSPEAHAQGPFNTSSDMFSFGLVVTFKETHTICHSRCPLQFLHVLLYMNSVANNLSVSMHSLRD